MTHDRLDAMISQLRAKYADQPIDKVIAQLREQAAAIPVVRGETRSLTARLRDHFRTRFQSGEPDDMNDAEFAEWCALTLEQTLAQDEREEKLRALRARYLARVNADPKARAHYETKVRAVIARARERAGLKS